MMQNPFRPGAGLLLAAALATAAPVHAEGAGDGSWLDWCDVEPPAGVRSHPVFDTAGNRRWLAFGGGRPAAGCAAALSLPVAAERILWAGPVPAEAGGLEAGVALQGPQGSAGFEVSEVRGLRPPPAAAPRGSLPLNTDLLTVLEARPFGGEERATVERGDGGLVALCRPGSRTAGISLGHPAVALPALAGLSLRLSRRGEGGDWRLGLSDGERLRRENPLMLGRLGAGDGDVVFAIPAGRWQETGVAVTLLCPEGGGRLLLSDLRLTAPPPPQPPVTATWAWRPAEWQQAPDRLLERLSGLGARLVFITVPVTAGGGVETPDRLAAFVASARKRGVAVWAVAGDPHAVLSSERPRFEALARAYAAYNAAVPESGSLAGLQLDIEPYLVPGYGLDPAGWDGAWVDTVNGVAAAAGGLAVDLAIPFWFGTPERRERCLDRLSPAIVSLTVMDYRSDPAAIRELAAPVLSWGAANRRGVRIALERGPLPDETAINFVPAEEGPLWRLSLAGGPVLLLLDRPARNGQGAAYAEAWRLPVAGAGQSFHDAPGRLDQLSPGLEAMFAAWPSFLGLAIHGTD